jgi:uncharacterized metal-binding protein (TIGR02443 family)
MTITRRFIAGARCPKCHAEDRIRLCRDSGDGSHHDGQREWVECMACGYESSDPSAPEHPAPLAEADADSEVSVVRFPRLD